MITLSYSFIRSLYKRYGYPFFTRPYDLNLCCFRNPEKKNNNVYNDYEVMAYTDEQGIGKIEIYECTTDPGLPSLLNPKNPKGTAVIVPGYYRKIWRTGLHKGRPALVQVNPVTVCRDADRDAIAGDSALKETGIFGIDNHGARTDRTVKFVNEFSEGCVVVPDPADMSRILELVDIQNKYGLGDKVSLALFNEPNVFTGLPEIS